MFKLEKEMTPIVEGWLLEQGYLIKKEYQFPWGYCDIVACKINPEKALLRKQKRSMTRLECLVYTKLPKEGILFKDLLESFYGYIDVDKMNKLLFSLKSKGFSYSDDFKVYQKEYPYFHSSLIAVELKLKDVSGVTNQAINNREAVDSSFIAVPLNLANKIFNDAFLKDVGLLGVSREKIEILIETFIPHENMVIKLHTLELFWTQYKKNIALNKQRLEEV